MSFLFCKICVLISFPWLFQLTGTIPTQVSNMTKLGKYRWSSIPLSKGSFIVLNHHSGFSLHVAMLLLDNNTITGDTAPACGLKNLQVFVADCGGAAPEVDCPCCSECCQDDGPICNDGDLLARFDPIWEDAYQREDYQFADDLWFVPVASSSEP